MTSSQTQVVAQVVRHLLNLRVWARRASTEDCTEVLTEVQPSVIRRVSTRLDGRPTDHCISSMGGAELLQVEPDRLDRDVADIGEAVRTTGVERD